MRAKAKSGQMYYATDIRKLYKDFGDNIEQRLVFNAVILHTDAERLRHIKPIVGKFYYVEETNCLWLFDTRWVLKIAESAIYNAYYADEYISPIINTDNEISGLNGDKILDNNGLLGDGSVIVRDTNRINRGMLKSNTNNSQLEVKSYLDDGVLFIPNAHLPYNNLSKSLGALHLTVEKKDMTNLDELNLNGSAHYYGNWNNYGDMYVVQKDKDNVIYPDYIPTDECDIVKFYITCTRQVADTKNVTYMVIRPMSESRAMVHILTTTDSNNSVVQNDMGELIFTQSGDIIDNCIIECTRKITNNANYKISQYIIDNYNETIIIKQDRETIVPEVEIGDTWADDKSDTTILVNRWVKDKVLTKGILEQELLKLKEEIKKLKTM